MWNILLVEDEIKQRQNLKLMLQQIDSRLKIHEAEDKNDALEICKNTNINLFFIDISLKSSSGLDLALEIRSIQRYELSWIVFITTHMEYITQAFKQTHCYDYIIKPYNRKEIVDIVKRIIFHTKEIDNTESKGKTVVFDLKDGIFMKICVNEIIFIEVVGRSCIVNTKKGKYTLNRIPLNKVLNLIGHEHIMQSHKAFAINIKYISRIEKVDARLSEIYFGKSKDIALLGYKFKNIILEEFKRLTYD